MLSDGAYSLSGTIGGTYAGPALENNGYAMVGGYWYGAGVEQYELYLPLILR